VAQAYETIEFRISKTGEDGQYNIAPRVIGQPPVAGADVTIELAKLNEHRNNPDAYGEALGKIIFDAHISDVYRSALQSAETKRAHLRVRLVLDDNAPELRDVLWERLQFGKGSRFLHSLEWAPLTTDAKHPFSRYVMGANPRLPAEAVTQRPLRVLLIIASPSDIAAFAPPIPINERLAAFEAFDDPTTFDVTALESDTDRPPTPENIQEAITEVEPHIVHFVCHGALIDNETQLFLEKENTTIKILKGSELVRLFENLTHSPALVTFMACETAKESPDPFDAFLPLGPELVKGGNVEAVVAMLAKVRMTTASLFAQVFYRRLSRHGTVDVAMNEARAAIRFQDDRQWSMPVLFMRTANGQIWRSAELPPAARQAVRPPHYYIDRPEIEQTIIERLTMDTENPNIVCMYGLPGVGKTVTARKICHELADTFPDGTLWADLKRMEIIDILRRFIKPYDDHFEPAGYREEYLLERLQRILSNKHTLIILDNVQSVGQVRQLVPQGSKHVAVLVIAASNLPGLISRQQSIYVPEMAPTVAEVLMRRYSENRLPNTAPETFRELANRSYYIPKHMLAMVHDCLRRRLRPIDYLEQWDQLHDRSYWVHEDQAALDHLHDQLASEAKILFPYVGVMDEGRWNADALVAVSKLNIQTVKTGLQQLADIGFIFEVENRRYRVSPLLQQRHQTLHRFLKDPVRRGQFFNQLMLNLVQQTSIGIQENDSWEPVILTKSDPVVINLDPLQLTFEQEVLTDLEFATSWSEVAGPGALIEEKQHLLSALQHARDQEDWALLQQISILGVGGFLVASTFVEASGQIDLQFAVLRDCNFIKSTLETRLQAARMIDCDWTECDLSSAHWSGIHLHRCDFTETEIIGAQLLGLIATDCDFTQVDFRRCDLRGATFRNCDFSECKFDNADLTAATFEGANRFNNCSFINVKGLGGIVNFYLIVEGLNRQIDGLTGRLAPETQEIVNQHWQFISDFLANDESRDLNAIRQAIAVITDEAPWLRPDFDRFLELHPDIANN
jgi:hypothetical protein